MTGGGSLSPTLNPSRQNRPHSHSTWGVAGSPRRRGCVGNDVPTRGKAFPRKRFWRPISCGRSQWVSCVGGRRAEPAWLETSGRSCRIPTPRRSNAGAPPSRTTDEGRLRGDYRFTRSPRTSWDRLGKLSPPSVTPDAVRQAEGRCAMESPRNLLGTSDRQPCVAAGKAACCRPPAKERTECLQARR